MQFLYDFARLPKDRQLLEDLNFAAGRLFDKLRGMDVKKLAISDYNKKYFGEYLASLQSSLQMYTQILAYTLSPSHIPADKFALLDYGGGCGILSLLAKEFGVGTVIYNDIYDVSCRDAEILGEVLGIKAEHYVQGDIDDLLAYLADHGLSCDGAASHDVIEHIYDIESFLGKVPRLSNGGMIFVMASGANIRNPMIARQLSRQHVLAELQDRKEEWGHKERDSLRSYMTIRREIIREHLAGLSKTVSADELEQLACKTRGMMRCDIIKGVDEYLETGNLPQPPSHPTNTCDPLTGNWLENLMDQSTLLDSLSKSGFKTRILCGYYGRSGNPTKSLAKRLANLCITSMMSQGIRIAPYFILYGQRQERK